MPCATGVSVKVILLQQGREGTGGFVRRIHAPSVPRAAPLASPLAVLPCPILRRLSSPRVAAGAAPALDTARLDWAAGLPWARGKRRGRGGFTSGWCWECTARVGTQWRRNAFVFPLRPVG